MPEAVALAILEIVRLALEIYKLELEALPMEQRVERSIQQWEDLKAFRTALTGLIPKAG